MNETGEKIYFDNGSTSFPKAPGVAEAVGELLKSGAFNINRGSYEGAYEVEAAVLETREQLARLFSTASEAVDNPCLAGTERATEGYQFVPSFDAMDN